VCALEGVRRPDAKAFYEVTDEPEPGKPPARPYYTELLAEYNDLKADAHPAPAKELAERRGLDRATMRTRLKTARRLAAEPHDRRKETNR
jgi:hypothetical protein